MEPGDKGFNINARLCVNSIASGEFASMSPDRIDEVHLAIRCWKPPKNVLIDVVVQQSSHRVKITLVDCKNFYVSTFLTDDVYVGSIPWILEGLLLKLSDLDEANVGLPLPTSEYLRVSETAISIQKP